MEYNNLGGSLPDDIGKLQRLEQLYLGTSKFSGSIPSSIGNMTSLAWLFMEYNRVERSIPPSLGNCKNLIDLVLLGNNLTSAIPKELIGLSSLSISLILSNNYFTGSLPFEVGHLVHLIELGLSENKLSGEIPNTLGSCISLERSYLEGNEFEGTIPQSINLRGLEEIDISRNKLSGQILEFISKLGGLKYLNLSYNDFEGELPKEGIFLNESGFSIVGNSRLCGGIPQLLLPACPSRKHHSSRGLISSKIFILVACALAFIIALSCFFFARSMLRKSRRRPVSSASYRYWKVSVSYSELVESTNGFSDENLIGSGSFGSVYKGVLPSDGTIVAVKVLNLQQQGASKSFNDECKALRSIRHRNLLKTLTACSSIDNRGNDFKSLVFEFMVNGSPDSWLHPTQRIDEQSQIKRLSTIQRLNIAIDVASALDYLHHQCETCIVHCDLKPSNVLLDEDMVAHVADFGLARFLLEASNDLSESQAMSVGLKVSIGYIPPEYGMGGQVSMLGDIYSYGILLLDMFTGKRPTDEVFRDGLSIHQLTAMAFPSNGMDVVDPSLLLYADVDDDRHGNVHIQERPITRYPDHKLAEARRLHECAVSVMQIGLSCSATLQAERILMNVVVNKMKTIRDSYINSRRS